MLILSRKVGETVVIGPEIRVVLLHAKDGQARLGIHVPADVEVHREEIAERIRRERSTGQSTGSGRTEAPAHARRPAAGKR